VTRVDVVIPAHNGWELTERCLAALGAQTLPHAVVLGDNGSTDGAPERVRSAFPHVLVLELGANLGFAVACNRAVAASDGDVIVLLNNDVEPRPDFLERLIEPLERDEGVGSVAPLLVAPAASTIDSFGLAVDPTLAGYPRLRGRPVGDAQITHPVLAGPTGAAAAYRRTAWNEVGGLDEGVFAYSEDVDLALRLRAAGWSTAGAVDSFATHIGSASAGARSSWQRYQGGFSRGYFLRRYGVLQSRSGLRAVATELIATFGDALHYSHDLAALRGRLAGWRAAAGQPRKPEPPGDAIDQAITFRDSLRRRREVYASTSD
jgi:N-acetylglucosaminyl-diphospho-decaprenol L-rhamnosyltransferase